MVKDDTKKKSKLLMALALTVIVSVGMTTAAVYLLGYFDARNNRPAGATTVKESRIREIAYWKAPMNPTEIYDKPGKSAMGMDLVPVYRDEMDSENGGGDSKRKIAYWKAPMNPTEIYNKPGKSAMGMDLVPVYEDELIGGVEVKINPVTQQNMGLRTQIAREQVLRHTIRTYGHVTTDETRIIRINPKFSGWVEKLYVDFTGKFVKKGAPLFEIYSPELLAAQEEYLVAHNSLKRRSGDGRRSLLGSSRRRLQYFEVPDQEIRAIERSGRTKKTLMIRSPFSGYVIDKNVELGGYIKAGTTVFRIADLSKVWVEVHIYEYELPWISVGLEAEMRLSYQPGRVFKGQVIYIYPYLQKKTRDIIVRLQFDNADMALKPDMYADVKISTTKDRGLVIPTEAVIRTGERNVVFVARPGGKFSPRDVTLGLALDGGLVQILRGVAPGEKVVTSGQFLLDSESKLKEAIAKMLEAKRAKAEVAAKAGDARREDAAKDEGFFEEMDEKDDFFKDLD